MTPGELKAFYESRKTEFTSQLQRINRSIRLMSNGRLLVAVVFFVVLYFGLTRDHGLLYFLLLLVIVFAVMVREHGRLFITQTHLQNLVKINHCEAQAVGNGDYSCFSPGNEFIDPHHPYAHDLDIFGDGSLFQYINRGNTLIGKKKFAARLSGSLENAEKISMNQQAIRELAGKTDFRHHFQAGGMEMEEQVADRGQLISWLKEPAFLYGKKVYRFILIVVPVLTLTLVIAAFFVSIARPFAVLMASFQWAFLGFHIKKVNAFHDYIGRKKNILQKYATLLHHLQQEKFSSSLLNELSVSARHADQKVQQLASLVHAFDARLNSMTTLFVNSLLLYDLQCVYRLEKWKEENAKNLYTWLEVVSEAEVLSSFGTFAFNHHDFTYASIHAGLSVSAIEMGHPLIPASECVANDFQIGDGPSVLIVTGANMAGKSTFLRTLGVNMVLALNGAPVCARTFRCPIIHLRTGMRTADSLKDHQSYFYAELDRLKGIMEDLRKDIPLMILLDEILKGTNSTDKQAGSIALVKQLLPHPCLAIIATHDLALGSLETEFNGRIRNYHFEANIENDQLSFDYKLKDGIAQKMNATFLMKKMGIIPS
jgi:ABC-type multidrug transport system fused ATPase/permease subunit